MTKTVLVVDNSRFMRTVLKKELSKEGYEVLTARNGKQAVKKLHNEHPDVITMDVQMPKMDGIEATGRIMSSSPTPIIMLSAYTDQDAEATLDALELGAVEFLLKPDGKEVSHNVQSLTERLVRIIETVTQPEVVEMVSKTDINVDYDPLDEAFVNAKSTVSITDPSTVTVPSKEPNKHLSFANNDAEDYENVSVTGEVNKTPTIIIGASTGGPKVVEKILQVLPIELNARVLIIQHMPINFTKRLADRLNNVTDYTVKEAYDGAMVGKGEALLAKGGYHLRVVDDENGKMHCRLDDGPKIHGLRPAIDVTMNTASNVVGTELIGVLLTGMGSDGSKGIKSIKEAGGYTIAQDKETSTVFGIPKEAISTGYVDSVFPDTMIVNGIVDYLNVTGDNK